MAKGGKVALISASPTPSCSIFRRTPLDDMPIASMRSYLLLPRLLRSACNSALSGGVLDESDVDDDDDDDDNEVDDGCAADNLADAMEEVGFGSDSSSSSLLVEAPLPASAPLASPEVAAAAPTVVDVVVSDEAEEDAVATATDDDDDDDDDDDRAIINCRRVMLLDLVSSAPRARDSERGWLSASRTSSIASSAISSTKDGRRLSRCRGRLEWSTARSSSSSPPPPPPPPPPQSLLSCIPSAAAGASATVVTVAGAADSVSATTVVTGLPPSVTSPPPSLSLAPAVSAAPLTPLLLCDTRCSGRGKTCMVPPFFGMR